MGQQCSGPHPNGTPVKKPRNSGGQPIGIKQPPTVDTKKNKRATARWQSPPGANQRATPSTGLRSAIVRFPSCKARTPLKIRSNPIGEANEMNSAEPTAPARAANPSVGKYCPPVQGLRIGAGP